jgi:methylphosphotriester-DNA--protein-cysteine methyltransferase
MEKNRAFEQMTIEDARWMGRQIAQLTEPQIQQALIAAGFDSTGAYLNAVNRFVSGNERAKMRAKQL